MANYNDEGSKYYYDPAVQSRMADDLDEWNRELKEQKPASSPKEDYLKKIKKSFYNVDVCQELIWRFDHPGERNSPAYLKYKNSRVSWIRIFLCIFLFVSGILIFVGGILLLPEFKHRNVLLLFLEAVLLVSAFICLVTLPKSTFDYFFYKKAYRLANKIWRRKDAKRYLGRK